MDNRIPAERRNERGSALMIAMIMAVVILGLSASLFVVTDSISRQAQNQEEIIKAIDSVEIGVADTVKTIQNTQFQYINEVWYGYVDNNLAGVDYALLSGTRNGVNFQSKIRSRNLAHSVGGASADYLTPSDPSSDIIDIYDIITVISPYGKNGNIRATRNIVELWKTTASGVDTPLYVHNDDSPTFAGQSVTISGKDHTLPGGSLGGGAANCSTCGGEGFIPCPVCGGDGLRDVGHGTNNQPCNNRGCTDPVVGHIECPDCGGTGLDAAAAGGGQPVEADYLQPDQSNAKLALGYNGDYGNCVFNGADEDQLYSVDPATGDPLQGESAYKNASIDLRALASTYIGGTAIDPQPTNPGVVSYNDIGNGTDLGSVSDTGDFQITYVGPDVDLTVAGQLEGGGVLVVDGDLHISGQFSYSGIIIVLGDMRTTGGGSSIHIFGSLMAESQSWVSGNADIWWCQDAINAVSNMVQFMNVTPVRKCWSEITPPEDLIPASPQDSFKNNC